MKLQWLLTRTLQVVTLLGVLLVAAPALAARLQFVQFDRNRNQLEFRTDGAVQPQAQLIGDPTRLVIDLPGTTVDLLDRNQAVDGIIRSVRIAQFNSQTTRIVVELAPGYSMDPQQIKFRGLSPSQWIVQLPTPQRMAGTPSSSQPDGSASPTSPAVSNRAATNIQAVNATPDGFFVNIVGPQPGVQVQRSDDRRTMTMDFSNTLPSPTLTERELLINSSLVERLVILETPSNPPSTRLVLTVSPDSPDWIAVPSQDRGVVLLPRTGSAQIRPTSPSAQSPTPQPSFATIQSIELNPNTNQLLIQADRSFSYEGGWRSGQYRLTLSPARLASNLKGPQLAPGGPLFRVRLVQEDAQTVAILVSPARGVRIDQLNAITPQLLALQLQRLSPPVASQPVTSQPVTSQPNPPINPPPIRVPPNQVPGPIPGQAPIGRVVVVVDPGHGGPDPGAVGIGGLREKDIVLSIAFQVASVLQQRGIQVVITRPDDRDLDLEPRVQIAEQVNATVFVSIHANALSLSRPDVSGVETYYYASGDRLAQTIHRSILQNLNVRDRGVRQARFYVLRKTSMPAVLVEVGFVTGAEDAARLGTSTYQSQMATAIANGVLQYLSENGLLR